MTTARDPDAGPGCGQCEPDYCACHDFFSGRLALWRGELTPTASDDACPVHPEQEISAND